MSDTPIGPALSPVDYDAWRRGYQPPSEHILIDALHFRGARVEMSTSLGGVGQAWIVLCGATLNRKARRQLLTMLQALDEALEDDAEPAPTSVPERESADA